MRWCATALLVSGVVGSGCSAAQTEVTGRLLASRDAGAPPLEGATLTVVNRDNGAILDAADSGADGAFVLHVSQGTNLAVEVRGPELATATFPGVSGVEDRLELDDGTLYAVTLAELDAVRAQYAGCPGADSGGAVVMGEIRILELVDEITLEHPTTAVGRADTTAADGEQYIGCYLDDEGIAYDPERRVTGPSGQFANFGVPGGVHDLDVRYEFATATWLGVVYQVWVPPDEADVVAPWWPAWVHWQF